MARSSSYAKRRDDEGFEIDADVPEQHTVSFSSFDYKYSDVFDPFSEKDEDIEELIDSDSEDDDDEDALENPNRVYHNPATGVLNDNVHQIPGSPWAKPANRPSNRPTEPLAIAKYASTLGFLITFGAVIYLFISAVWNYTSVGRVIIEIFLAIISFFGLFWNSYFAVSSIFKCFIPAKAFRSNTKYCSMIPEEKSPLAEWLNVTIQIPVYKESLQQVLMPTLKSCVKSRDYYMEHSGAKCNICVCDDGMMAFLKDNFAAADRKSVV